ncbi:GumC family protein [Chelativorans sp. Marseille-P2723]|uniref:GumC family protein n=1 Tax=Chelativorans sp. Marseille-P2723 TaxID=2709133 RepID=UPI001FEE23C5|nr:GumC family protein [Chelativorans sp. Marseille-P2723]
MPSEPARIDANPYWQPLINPVRVINGILAARRLIAATTVLGALAGVLVALATPKHYYAATDILFDPRSLQLSDRDLTSGNLPSDATLALIENQVSIITSGPVLNRVVQKLNLAQNPEFNGQGGSILGMLLSPRALFSLGGGSASEETRHALAVQNLAKKLNVSRNERTFIIHLGASTEDAERSALIANTTAEVYLAQAGTILQRTANQAATELTQRLDELRAEVEAAERAVADFKAEHGIVDAQGRLITDDEMVRLNDQLATARARTAELNARAASARQINVDDILGGTLPEQVSSPVMTELLAQYAGLRREADRGATRLGPRHPDYQAAQAELSGVRQAMADELRRVSASIQVELQRAVQLEQELASRLARLKLEKGELESQQVTLRELEREAAARRAVYEAFLVRARDTGEQQTMNTANATVISEAYPPLLPSGPSRASIAIAGAILGLLSGISIGAARGAWASLRENTRKSPPAPKPPSPGTRRQDLIAMNRRKERHGQPHGEVHSLPAAGSSSRLNRNSSTRTDRGQQLNRSQTEMGVLSSSLEMIRKDLRSVRQEIDALAKDRSRRRWASFD